MQQWLSRAAAELEVQIVVGYVAQLPGGVAVRTQALFPELGGVLRTLVTQSADGLDAPTRIALVDQGFSISTFAEPMPGEEFDVGSFAEMFAEWGWTSDTSLKPNWMK